ncbi:MAG: aminotransferase class III-fold pyridoxal phosphate-dependent enzyme [Chloroflexi bacterium]|nr:aminotransferase class III-fold pyridoxal phosphate-dependent enzyme [Chloroflexota bacterium]
MATVKLPEAADHLSAVWGRYGDFIADHAEGVYVYDTEGRRHLDFTSGIGVTNTGHCHPKVVAAIREQAGKMIHAELNIQYHQPVFRLIDELRTVVPPNLDAFFFTNSGAEAVEGAIKLARQTSHRANVIAFQGAFHGRTYMAMSLTNSKSMYRQGYAPLVAGVHIAPFPYHYRMQMTESDATEFCLNELRFMFATQCPPDDTAAIIIESVLGEGGYVVPSKAFMQGLRQICDEFGILLILDEVQSGFGRTGKWFACEHYGIQPDIMVMAKGLASGMPLSAIAARKSIMDKWIVSSHGGTYTGNAIGCAAAVATIQAMKEERMIENAAKVGGFFMDGLSELQGRYPVIGDVRGVGLMIAAEFGTPRAPNTKAAKELLHKAGDDGLMLLTCGPFDNTIRFVPPLIVTQQQAEDALNIIDKALGTL